MTVGRRPRLPLSLEDKRMAFGIPEHGTMHIRISVGHPAVPPAADAPAPASRRLVLKGVLILILLGGAVELGRTMASNAASAAPNAVAMVAPVYDAPPLRDPSPSPLETAQPSPQPPPQMPQAFTAQLRARPTVTPPPGASSAGAQPPNPFGLHE
jgi:hypothetical protein